MRQSPLVSVILAGLHSASAMDTVPVPASNIDRVNAPTLIGATSVAGHPPAEPAVACKNEGQVHHGRDKTLRVATPRLTASNRTATIGADRAVISAHNEGAAGCKDVLKRIPTVRANL